MAKKKLVYKGKNNSKKNFENQAKIGPGATVGIYAKTKPLMKKKKNLA